MKRRNLFLSFVVIALLLIGVGFATISDTLSVDVTATPNDARLDLQFVQADSKVTVGKQVGVTVISGTVTVGSDAEEASDYVTSENDKATVAVTGLSTIGDQAVITLNIKNCSLGSDMKAVLSQENIKAAVAAQLTAEEQYYYTVTAQLGPDANAKTVDLAYGANVDLVITITMKVSLSDSISPCTLVFDLTGTYDMVPYAAQ